LGYAHSETEDARYEALTLEQVKAAAAKYLQADRPAIAIVRPEKDS
jgi:predicted Zn-dependent peptidase